MVVAALSSAADDEEVNAYVAQVWYAYVAQV